MQGFELPDTSWRYRSDTMHNIRLWKHLERNFAPLFLLAPAAAASEPAPGQPAEVLRARKRPPSTALAGPIPGQLLGLKSVSVCKSSVCATPRVFYKAGVCSSEAEKRPKQRTTAYTGLLAHAKDA